MANRYSSVTRPKSWDDEDQSVYNTPVMQAYIRRRILVIQDHKRSTAGEGTFPLDTDLDELAPWPNHIIKAPPDRKFVETATTGYNRIKTKMRQNKLDAALSTQ